MFSFVISFPSLLFLPLVSFFFSLFSSFSMLSMRTCSSLCFFPVLPCSSLFISFMFSVFIFFFSFPFLPCCSLFIGFFSPSFVFFPLFSGCSFLLSLFPPPTFLLPSLFFFFFLFFSYPSLILSFILPGFPFPLFS